MAKYLVLLIVVAVVWFAFKTHARNAARRAERDAARPIGEDMVRCARCGVHLPRSESIAASGKVFCSEEHRQLDSP